MKPLYIVRHVATPERVECIKTLRSQIPVLIVIEDRDKDPMGTFCKALSYDANKPIVMLEDDIELCNNFVEVIEQRIQKIPGSVINFFGNCKSNSRRSRWQKGKYFLWLQCVYFPPGYGNLIADYWPTWRDIKSREVFKKNPNTSLYTTETLFDHMVASWLESRNESYYVSLPALVQHLPIASAINPKLSTNRQNKTFVKG